jgi:indole-3-glycerol phosphate synthase
VILDEILDAKQRAHTLRDPIADWERKTEVAALPPARSLAAAVRGARSRPAVIAEFKRRSPSAGAIREGGDAAAVAGEYAAAGAAALSVLTDERWFGGRLEDLAAARSAGRPIVRKDFLLFDEDLVDARAAGADAVLLIARALDDGALRRLHAQALGYGLEALVEVHSEAEWERALAAGATLVGVNHRDLDTLAIDLSLSERIAARRPDGVLLVAESGLRSGADLRLMRERGFDAVLVGEALLRARSPGEALAGWLSELG